MRNSGNAKDPFVGFSSEVKFLSWFSKALAEIEKGAMSVKLPDHLRNVVDLMLKAMKKQFSDLVDIPNLDEQSYAEMEMV